MSIALFILIIGLFAIPWTLAGLLYPPAAGMGHRSRRRIFVYGCLQLVACLSLSGLLLPEVPTPANAAPGLLENILTTLLLLACVAWPLAALVLKIRARRRDSPTCAKRAP